MHLLRRARRIAEAVARPGAILMYHRIAEVPRDPWRLCVRPSSFRDQVAVMAKGGVIPVAALAGAGGRLRNGRAPFAITFDDGFADNLTEGLPILEAHEAPATIFVVSGALGRRRAFWWDALERLIFDPPRLPEALETTIGGTPVLWRTSGPEDGLARMANRLFLADDGTADTDRQSLYFALWEALVAVPPAEQDGAIDALEAWAGVSPATDPALLPMTAEELARIAAHPLVTIGSHTVGHRPLTRIDDAALRAELAGSKAALEAVCGRPVTLFSYPFGFVDRRVAGAVAEAGYAAACCSHPGLAGIGSDRFRLPRLQAFDDPADRFSRRLLERYPAVSQR